MQIEKPPKSQPRYLEVADALLADIMAGQFPVGTMLPTEIELCGRFDVRRFTVRQALRRLDEMGLVSRRHGPDRNSAVWGKSVAVRVGIGGRRIIKKKTRQQPHNKIRH